VIAGVKSPRSDLSRRLWLEESKLRPPITLMLSAI
jgi:hypothetical protein